MNRRTLVATADTMCSIRPDWNQGGCISQLQLLAHTWQGSEAQLIAHSVFVASDPAAITPAAINNMPPTTPTPRRKPGRSNRDVCSICGRSPEGCRALSDAETANGIPGPHQFLTVAQAEDQAAKHQISRNAAQARTLVASPPKRLDLDQIITDQQAASAREPDHPGPA